MYFKEYLCRFSRNWHHFCFLVVKHLKLASLKTSIFFEARIYSRMCVRLRWVSRTRMSISYHIISYHISHHITSHHIIHIISHLIASHRITSITSHHTTSHHIISAIMTYHISYHIKYRIIYRIIFFIVVFRFRSINPYFMAKGKSLFSAALFAWGIPSVKIYTFHWFCFM